MIRKCTDEDISDEELEKVINPFYDNYHEYIITYVMPEVIAFYIASSYSRNAMWEATFYQHYNSAKDIFNVNDDEDDLRWKCVFEIFYYCGLRKGELKGLTWKDIYFDKKVLYVNKQITQLNNRTKF